MGKKTYTVIPRMEKSLFREEVIPLLVIPCLRDSRGAVGIYAKIGQHGYAAPLYIQDSTRPRDGQDWPIGAEARTLIIKGGFMSLRDDIYALACEKSKLDTRIRRLSERALPANEYDALSKRNRLLAYYVRYPGDIAALKAELASLRAESDAIDTKGRELTIALMVQEREGDNA